MIEDQVSIATWAEETFGKVTSNIRVACRANEEMAELLRCLSAKDDSPKAAEEIADVVIVLYRLAQVMGFSLEASIEAKMALNRRRKWAKDDTGHGYHVRPEKLLADSARERTEQ